MYRVGQFPDHVQRTYKEKNRWMYVPEVREPFTFKDFISIALLVLSFGSFLLTMCVMVAMALM